MKLHFLLPLLAITTSAVAGFKLPSSVFEMSELTEAKASATKKGKPLIFVLTPSSSNWGISLAVGSAAIKSFRKAGVVVFVDAIATDSLPMPKCTQAFERELGPTLPQVYVTTADGSHGIKGISCGILISNMRGAIHDLQKELAAKEESKSKVLNWTNTDGKTITASVKSVSEKEVIFRMKGKEVPYPLAKLSPESRKAAEALR